MIVDPTTGLPVGDDMGYGQANSFLGQAGVSAAVGAGVAPNSRALEMLASMPSSTSVMGWNAFRGANTIIGGPAHTLTEAKSFRSTFSPRFAGRFSRHEALGGMDVRTNVGLGAEMGKSYSPFNFLADYGNKGMNMLANRFGDSGIISRATESGWIKAKAGGGIEDAFGKGSYSRLNAVGRLQRGASTTNVTSFLSGTDKGLADAFFKARSSLGMEGALTRSQAIHAVGMSNTGTISSRVMGYVNTFAGGEMDVATRGAAKLAGRDAYVVGAKKAAEHMASAGIEKVGGRFLAKEAIEIGGRTIAKQGAEIGISTVARAAATKGGMTIAGKLGGALAINAIPVAGQVISAVMLATMAYDIGKMGVAAFKGAADFTKDAVKSFRGSVAKPVMGMGYRDTTVAATSRQRGVMAIQNSRLNARSVLGSEAGAMHAHFG